MLSYIKGAPKFIGDSFAIIENNGLGYKIFCPEQVLFEIKNKKEAELYLYEHIREDQDTLFGFSEIKDLQFFEQLITVSGVGPKTGLNVFGAGNRDSMISAILSGDASVFKKVTGIGGKTAERIVLELKNKVEASTELGAIKTRTEMDEDADFMEAIISLGFNQNSARDALRQIDRNLSLTEKVRLGLKILKQ
ncbi:MAG: Holliday junction branch migration protein RuvA [Patescibacteria group bacterium]